VEMIAETASMVLELRGALSNCHGATWWITRIFRGVEHSVWKHLN